MFVHFRRDLLYALRMLRRQLIAGRTQFEEARHGDQFGGQSVIAQATAAIHSGSTRGYRKNPHN